MRKIFFQVLHGTLPVLWSCFQNNKCRRYANNSVTESFQSLLRANLAPSGRWSDGWTGGCVAGGHVEERRRSRQTAKTVSVEARLIFDRNGPILVA